MECLLARVSLSVKRGEARLARAMRTMAFQPLKMLNKLTDTNTLGYDFEMEKYKEGLKRASQKHFCDQDNNLQAYKKVYLHCTPSMITKLEMMAGWIKIEEEQDGIGLIKLVHSAIFSQDGSWQSIAEYISVMKKLFLLFQGKGMSIAEYAKAFNALLDVAEQAGVVLGGTK